MTRYFRQYFHSDPMLELDESTAQRRGSYVAEVEGAIRVFRCFANHKLESLVYPGWDDPATPLADARRRAEGVPIAVYSPVQERPDGGKAWRVWYADAGGEIQSILEPEIDAEGRYLRESRRGPDGQLRDSQEYVYDRYGELLEVVTHGADGRVLNRQHS